MGADMAKIGDVDLQGTVGMTDDAVDRVEQLRQRLADIADDDAMTLGRVEWQARSLAQRHGNNVEARALHVAILARLGRRDDGIEALNATLPLLPWVATPLTPLRLAGSALGFGRAEQAVAIVRRVMTRWTVPPADAMHLLALIPLVAGDVALLREVADRALKQNAFSDPVFVHAILRQAELLDRLADHQRIVLAGVAGDLCEVRMAYDPPDSDEPRAIVLDYRLASDPALRPPTVVSLATAPLSPRLVERFARVPALADMPQNEG